MTREGIFGWVMTIISIFAAPALLILGAAAMAKYFEFLTNVAGNLLKG